jgi:hypothetical protein
VGTQRIAVSVTGALQSGNWKILIINESYENYLSNSEKIFRRIQLLSFLEGSE